MSEFNIPTRQQLYAYEQLARRERAKAQAELLIGAGRWLKQAFIAVATRPYAPARRAVPNV